MDFEIKKGKFNKSAYLIHIDVVNDIILKVVKINLKDFMLKDYPRRFQCECSEIKDEFFTATNCGHSLCEQCSLKKKCSV